MAHRLNQDSNVALLSYRSKAKQGLSDQEKIVFAHHHLEESCPGVAIGLLSSVSKEYLTSGIYKDLSRSLLCWTSLKYVYNDEISKESEFYLVVYRLLKSVELNNINFTNKEYVDELKNYVFKDFL